MCFHAACFLGKFHLCVILGKNHYKMLMNREDGERQRHWAVVGKPLGRRLEKERRKARGHWSQVVLMCLTQWSQKSQTPSKQMEIHVRETLFLCLAEMFSLPLLSSVGV